MSIREMDVEMGLPSPKTPSMKRISQVASPRVIEVYRTPRSEGFHLRKVTMNSPNTHSPISKSVWNSDTPPMSGSSANASPPLRKLREPTTDTKGSSITIPERRFYNSSGHKKCLLPLFKTAALSSSISVSRQEPKSNSLKRKRSKSLDHRKRNDGGKLNKNICHKIKRPKKMKIQKPQNLPVTESTEIVDVPSPASVQVDQEKMEISFQSNASSMNYKPKLPEKKLSVNVNRLVRVNVLGGELKFTKHLKSPRKTPKSKNSVDPRSDLCDDWLQEKVDDILGALDKENDISDVSSLTNDSVSAPSPCDSTVHLSDAFCELGVSELRASHPTVGHLAERKNREILSTRLPEYPQIGNGELASLTQENGPPLDDSSDKLFPVFYKNHQVKNSDSNKSSPSNHPRVSLPAKSTDGLEQLIIDAGQKSLGPSNCPECGFYYQKGDPDEEKMHVIYHDSCKPVVKHTAWKWERVACTFPDGRVVHVCPTDPKPWWSKVSSILEKANEDLGISLGGQLPKNAHAYFYVSNMLVLGCLIAEPIRVAYRMLESDRKELERLKEPGEENAMTAPSFCSNTPVRGSRCGINRIWVCASERRKGIASKLLDAVRATFVYGHILKLNEIAFSDPTPLGMALAVNYTKSPNFLVYKITKD
ncbi:N-acetyltransferase ESCO2 [Ischnura elegans]|uniref:N-acetyltransferase ESCO2 n=1 Tax=Ischnura elegans TaxID=197161 RepID=UPI001ED887FD|nr:N-acetyltransferase ESCO2 [Ischnura elegans]